MSTLVSLSSWKETHKCKVLMARSVRATLPISDFFQRAGGIHIIKRMKVDQSIFADKEDPRSMKVTEGWSYQSFGISRDPIYKTSLQRPNDPTTSVGCRVALPNDHNLSSDFSQPESSISSPCKSLKVPIKRKRSEKLASPMDAFCFSGTFDQLTPKNNIDLLKAFINYKGKLPSRREIRLLSLEVGLSQSRIRRWFLEHSALEYAAAAPRPPAPIKPETSPPKNVSKVPQPETEMLFQKLEGIEEKLDLFHSRLSQLEESLYQTKNIVDSLQYFSQSWLPSWS